MWTVSWSPYTRYMVRSMARSEYPEKDGTCHSQWVTIDSNLLQFQLNRPPSAMTDWHEHKRPNTKLAPSINWLILSVISLGIYIYIYIYINICVYIYIYIYKTKTCQVQSPILKKNYLFNYPLAYHRPQKRQKCVQWFPWQQRFIPSALPTGTGVAFNTQSINCQNQCKRITLFQEHHTS